MTPVFLVCITAVLSADSTASAPVEEKMVWLRLPGVISLKRFASKTFTSFGCTSPMPWIMRRDWSFIARATALDPWPIFTTEKQLTRSKYRLPSTSRMLQADAFLKKTGYGSPMNVSCGHSKRLSDSRSSCDLGPGMVLVLILGREFLGRSSFFFPLNRNGKNEGRLRLSFKKFFRVQRGHAAGAGGRHGLAIFEILHVPAGKN